ncbi:MAG: TatD family hydrolase [Bacteroidales bacterium]|nr:TatD family hydrolase [Bacteroidales bacterium]
MIDFIDTHSHLYLPEFDADRAEVVERALHYGVGKIILPNIDSSSIAAMNSMASSFPGVCYPLMGLHPTSVNAQYETAMAAIENEMQKGGYVGIGEIGIDLYWDKEHLREQQLVFTRQLDLSLDHGLPVVIHARESFPEIMEILESYKNKGLKGIFHAYTGSPELAKKITGMGFKLGIGGIVTYKNSTLPAVIKTIALEHLVLETDSPYLTPVPFRGKRNESSYIPYIARAIEQIKNVPLEEVARVTTTNALELFSL